MMKQRGPNGQKWGQHLRRTTGMNHMETPEQFGLRVALRNAVRRDYINAAMKHLVNAPFVLDATPKIGRLDSVE